MELRLSFPFALGARSLGVDNIAIAGFLPRTPISWTDTGQTITFHAFLIVLERDAENRPRTVWLPYFHVVEQNARKIVKYGQWAPYIGVDLFRDLLSQAENAGYL